MSEKLDTITGIFSELESLQRQAGQLQLNLLKTITDDEHDEWDGPAQAALARAELSPDELTQLIKQAADMLAESTKSKAQARPSYVSFFGSGIGAFASIEETDRFLREERDAWDE